MPSGSDSILRIAGITIALRSGDPRIRWSWNGAAARFLVPSSPSRDLDLLVEPLRGDPPGGDPVFDSGAVWRLLRRGSESLFECHSAEFGEGPYKVAVIDGSFSSGSILIREDLLGLDLNPLDYPLDEVLFANLLARGRGVELHSCGVIDRERRGHLFVGVSGAGKTTTARFWGDRAAGIVSDDRVVVREIDGVMWMFGTPWHGEAELSMPEGVPLSAVYLLTQAPAHRIVDVSSAEAVARLFRCVFPLFHDPDALQYTLQFLERITAAVPVRELQFARDAGLVTLVLDEVL